MTFDTSKHDDSLTAPLEEKLEELAQMVSERDTVIEEYEAIFDQQLVELPCVCGENIFKGLFSPKTLNECECEKCKNKYKVMVSYDSVLVSQPISDNEIFDTLQKTKSDN